MRFRRKLLLMFLLPPSVALLVLFTLHVYSTLKEVKEVALREGTHYVETVCSYVADLLYYGDYDRIAVWLETIPAHNIEDIVVVSSEGFLIASKRRGLVIFERYPDFESIRGTEEVRVVEDPLRDLFVFAGPIKLEDRVLGYVVSYHRFSDLESIVKEHSFSFATMVVVFLILTYAVAYHVSTKISNHINLALSYLESVGREVFDLPDPPKTGDEFENLFEGIRSMAGRLKEVHISRDFYQNLINSLTEGILVISGEGRILEANASAGRMFGVSPEDLKGRPISEVLPEIYREIRDLMEGSSERAARRIRFKGERGGDLYLLLSLSTYDGLYILLVSDITRIARYEEKLKELAERDYLTKVYNRRMFENLLKHEMERAKRHGRPLSLIMFDIDHFKRINDTFGHQVGDQVLKRLVDVVRSNLRRTDILARWGGEEFMILLPETSTESACKLAERLRRTVENADFGKAGRITVSFGVAGMRREDTAESLVRRADRAVYEAKRKGRNRVERAD
jgi:diguanylate cyclase (GGDEF)-like protein/PAS domain S-box-containing protein